MIEEYSARVLSDIDNGPGCWKSQTIGVFRGDEQIGSYKRNYSSFKGTFVPFKKGEKWFALYSPDYTGTRLMELPSCKDLGGEARDGGGFCPVEYYVPRYYLHRFKLRDTDTEDTVMRIHDEHGDKHDADVVFDHYEQFAFVSGCVWGDDSSWKIQYIDLSRVDEGIIKREDRFGYIELPRNVGLRQAIVLLTDDDDPPYGFTIACEKHFKADGKEFS